MRAMEPGRQRLPPAPAACSIEGGGTPIGRGDDAPRPLLTPSFLAGCDSRGRLGHPPEPLSFALPLAQQRGSPVESHHHREWRELRMAEQWKAIPGYEGRYEVSDQGRVRSVDRVVVQKSKRGSEYKKTCRGRVLRPGKMNEFNHVSVVLGRKGGSKCVHALVLLAFVGPRPAGMDVCHNNGVGDDNRLSNLRYASRADNNRDMVKHGKRKLTVDQIRSLRSERESGAPIKTLAAKYGVCPNHARYVANRFYYAHIT